MSRSEGLGVLVPCSPWCGAVLFALEAKGADNLSEEQITTQAAALAASHGVDTGVLDTALVRYGALLCSLQRLRLTRIANAQHTRTMPRRVGDTSMRCDGWDDRPGGGEGHLTQGRAFVQCAVL